MSTIQNYKTPEHEKPERIYKPSRVPQARNPIYQKQIYVKCPYCNLLSKKFKTLYRLYHHFTYHHPNEPRFREITMSVADLIIEGVL